MELDDYKQSWKENSNKKIKKTDIMELIQHKSYGPIGALKKEFRKQIVVIATMPFFLLLTNLDDLSKPLGSVMFWSYSAFCLCVVIFASYSYGVVKKMEGMDGLVKANLSKQVNILEKLLQWKNIGLKVSLLFFVLLAETIPYFQHYRMLDKWHSLSVYIRYGTYAILFIFQYFFNSRISQHKFGRHLWYLKKLLNEIES